MEHARPGGSWCSYYGHEITSTHFFVVASFCAAFLDVNDSFVLLIFYFLFCFSEDIYCSSGGVLYDGGMGFVWDCRRRSYGAALLAKAACLRAWANWAWRFASFCSYFLRQSISWTLVTANFILRSFAGLTMGVSKK